MSLRNIYLKNKKKKTFKNSLRKKSPPKNKLVSKLNSESNSRNPQGKQIFFVHIGKTAGTTLETIFNHYKLYYNNIHCEKPPYHSNYKYIISIRDPLSQTISAFNWRYHLLVNKNHWKSFSPEYEYEKEILKKYKNINNISERLYHKNGKANTSVHQELREIYHIKLGTSYYLKDLLSHLQSSQIIAVITTENLEQDLQDHLHMSSKNIKTNHMSSSKHHYSTYLSELGRKNLRKFLDCDYTCLAKLKTLFDYSLLDKK
tara:strand:- start:805 stop:1581 length:777 start_codon:yes stop_codon:yes gene_type:complete